MTIRDDQLNPGKPPFFEVLEQPRPERFILTFGDSRTQNLPVTILAHLGDHQDRFGNVPCSVTNFVVGSIGYPSKKEINRLLVLIVVRL